jgi:hypothetical protein
MTRRTRRRRDRPRRPFGGGTNTNTNTNTNMNTTKLLGRQAYDYAYAYHLDLHKSADPISDACTYAMGDEADRAAAADVLAEDPSLLHLTADVADVAAWIQIMSRD